MKRLVLSLLLCMAASPVLAEGYHQQTLVTGELEHGGFGAVVLKFTEINKEFGVLVGGRGGWIINHSLVIGAGGYGLSNDFEIESAPSNWGLGYGGLELEYIARSSELIHVSAQTLIGAGGIGYRYDRYEGDWFDEDWDGEAFFVLEPGVNIMLNVIENFRIGLGASYRYVRGIDDDDDIDWTSDEDLSEPSIVLTLKFGIF